MPRGGGGGGGFHTQSIMDLCKGGGTKALARDRPQRRGQSARAKPSCEGGCAKTERLRKGGVLVRGRSCEAKHPSCEAKRKRNTGALVRGLSCETDRDGEALAGGLRGLVQRCLCETGSPFCRGPRARARAQNGGRREAGALVRDQAPGERPRAKAEPAESARARALVRGEPPRAKGSPSPPRDDRRRC